MPTSRNRTKWPLKGGAVSIQPGWFPGHALAQIYINMGYGNEPLNYSHTMLPVFQITGPTNQEYGGQFCLPQVPLPANYTPKVGDNATIQVIELAQHGAALYNVSLIHLAIFIHVVHNFNSAPTSHLLNQGTRKYQRSTEQTAETQPSQTRKLDSKFYTQQHHRERHTPLSQMVMHRY